MESENEYEIQMVITNEFGEFRGRKFVVNESDYKKIITVATGFYSSGGFDLVCEDGGFMVFPPEITQKSILKINKSLKDV